MWSERYDTVVCTRLTRQVLGMSHGPVRRRGLHPRLASLVHDIPAHGLYRPQHSKTTRTRSGDDSDCYATHTANFCTATRHSGRGDSVNDGTRTPQLFTRLAAHAYLSPINRAPIFIPIITKIPESNLIAIQLLRSTRDHGCRPQPAEWRRRRIR